MPHRAFFSSHKIKLLVLLCLILVLLVGHALLGGPLLEVANGRRLSLSSFIFTVAESQVLLIGESHDNVRHHQQQLAIIRELHEEAERPMAIGLEMFEARSQQYLDAWVAGTLSLGRFVSIYRANWSEPWYLYQDIFLYAREHHIPLIGLNASRQVVEKVGRQGFAALSSDDLKQLPGEITCDVDEKYEKFIQRVYTWHGSGTFTFRSFCEAQMIWDTTMAINVLRYHERNPERMVVVLAGNGHCWKPAIPRQIERRSKVPCTVVLPENIKQNRFTVKEDETDYLWLRGTL